MKLLFKTTLCALIIFYSHNIYSQVTLSQICEGTSLEAELTSDICDFTITATFPSPPEIIMWQDWNASELGSTAMITVSNPGSYTVNYTIGSESYSCSIFISADDYVQNTSFQCHTGFDGDDAGYAAYFRSVLPEYYWTFEDDGTPIDLSGDINYELVVNANNTVSDAEHRLSALSIPIEYQDDIIINQRSLNRGALSNNLEFLGEQESLVGSSSDKGFKCQIFQEGFDDIAMYKEITVEVLAKLDFNGAGVMNILKPSTGIGKGLTFKILQENNEWAFTYGIEADLTPDDGLDETHGGIIESNNFVYAEAIRGNEIGFEGWNHFVLTFDLSANTGELFINGVSIDSGDLVDEENEADKLFSSSTDFGNEDWEFLIGTTFFNSYGGEFFGNIDELALYTNHILSPALIYQHYLDAIPEIDEDGIVLNEGGKHYTYYPRVSESEIEAPLSPLAKYRAMEFPIGYMESEFISGTEGISNLRLHPIDVPGDGDWLSSNNDALGESDPRIVNWMDPAQDDNFPGWYNKLENPIDQLKLYPLPRYKKEHNLRENFPWFEVARLAGHTSRQYSVGELGDEDYIDKIKIITEELTMNWFHGIPLPKNIAQPFNGYNAVASFANLHPEIPVHTHINWDSHSRVLHPNAGLTNLSSHSLSDPNYYFDNDYDQEIQTNTFSLLGSRTLAYEDGLSVGSRRLTDPERGFDVLVRPIDIINENGELGELNWGSHNFFDSSVAFNQVFIDNDLLDYTSVSSESLFEDLVVAPVITDDELDYVKDEWWKFVAGNVTDFRSEYLRGVKNSHPSLSLPTTHTTYYSVDGYGGLNGFNKYDWEAIRETSAPFKNPLTGGINNRYSTCDFYPKIHVWATSQGSRHGLSYLMDARVEELLFGDKLSSPFVSPGWSQVPDLNMRPGQWLGLLKSNMMFGAEFFYTSHFYDDGVPSPQDPMQYIWQISSSACAHAVFSQNDNFLFKGIILGADDETLNQPVQESTNLYAVVRENEENGGRYLANVTWQRASSKYSIEDVNRFNRNASFTVGNTYLTVDARLQGSTYIYDPTQDDNIIFYQLDKWHEPWHPSWWEKGFELEAELNDNPNNDNSNLHTEVMTEGVYEPLDEQIDLTDFITYQQPSPNETGDLEFYFSPRSAKDGELFNYNLFFRAETEDGASATIKYKVYNENDELIISDQICFTAADWAWYKAPIRCSDCMPNHLLCQLPQGEYKLKLSISDNCRLDKTYIESTISGDAYYTSIPADTHADLETVISKLYPTFGQKYGIDITLGSLEITCPLTPAFQAQEVYCTGPVTIINDTELSECSTVGIDSGDWTWTLVAEDNTTTIYTSDNFEHTFMNVDNETYQLTLTYGTNSFGPVTFNVNTLPIVGAVSDQNLSVESGAEFDLSVSVTNSNYDSFSYDWYPNMWEIENDGNDANEISMQIFNTTTDAISYNGTETTEFGDAIFLPQFCVTVNNEGCTAEPVCTIITVNTCDINVTYELTDLVEDWILPEGTSTDIEGSTYEDFSFYSPTFQLLPESTEGLGLDDEYIVSDFLSVPAGSNLEWTVAGVVQELNPFDNANPIYLTMLDNMVSMAINPGFIDHGQHVLVEYKLTSSGGCVNDGYFIVRSAQVGCTDSRAANYAQGATELAVSNIILSEIDVDIFLTEISGNVCEGTEPCIGVVQASTLINDNLILTSDAYWWRTRNDDSGPWTEYTGGDTFEGACGGLFVDISTTYGCTYSKEFFLSHPHASTLSLTPPDCLNSVYSLEIANEVAINSVEIWSNSGEDPVLIGNINISGGIVDPFNLEPGSYYAIIDQVGCIATEYLEIYLPILELCPENTVDAEFDYIDNLTLQQLNQNDSYKFNTNLTIGASTSGVINDVTFCMAEGKSIIIEAGANITFNGCIFTSCGVWEGIRIEPQGDISHVFLNGGEVSNAVKGIRAIGAIGASNQDLLELRCLGTDFINNLSGVFLRNVEHPDDFYNSTTRSITGCDFIKNDSFDLIFMNHSMPTWGGIQEADCKGFSVYDCYFSNDNYTNKGTFQELGIGVSASHSRLQIRNSEFQNLDRGISCHHKAGIGEKILIHNNDIKRCQTGIYNMGLIGQEIFSNNISVGELMVIVEENENPHPLDIDLDYKEGIVVIGGGVIDVQENNITGASGDLMNPFTKNIGIRARDIKQEDIIRKNYLTNLTYGNLANGSNVGTDDETIGLRYLCNENSGNEFDFAVAGFDLWFEDLEVAIKPEQNVPVFILGEPGFLPTGNSLSDPNDVSTNLQFDHRGTNQSTVNYRFNPSQEPTLFNNITPDENPEEIGLDDLCPSDFVSLVDNDVDIVFINEEILDKEDEIGMATLELNTAEYLYVSLIDDGDTDALRDEVDFAWADDVWAMRDKLLNQSPNISSKVAYDVADKTDVFPHPVALDIFLANPHLAKDHRFLKYLQKKANPLPEYMIELIYNAPSEATLRKELEHKISNARTIKLTAENRLVHLLKAQEADRSEVYGVIENMNTTASDMLMVEYELENGNYAAADDRLAILDERMFIKDPVIRTELEQYYVWYELRKDMLMDNRDFDQITDAEILILKDLALQYFFTSAGKKAIAYLDFQESGWFIPPAYEGDHEFSFRSAELEPEEEFKVNVYPNPGSVFINFEIENNLTSLNDYQLDIYDSSGRIIHSQTLKPYESFITLETTSWSSGLYTYHIRSKTKILKTDGFEIIR